MEGNSMVLDIQKFAEGGEGAGTGEGAAIAQPQSTGDADAKSAAADTASVAGEQKSTESTQEITLDSFFEEHPELKKEADKRTQKAVQNRVHQINKSMKPTNDLIDKLMVVHGVKSMEELSKKLETSLPEEYAMQHGVDNDIGAELMNARLKALQEERDDEYRKQQYKVERQMHVWQQESEEVKKLYPDFNFETELQNRDFPELLKRGISMKHAYELMHMDDIKNAAERKAAEAYSKSVNANLARPSENGSGNQSAVSHSSDVSKLTKKERADMAKRAARGEVITFR